ncbi:MAG TPA: phasin family protein [Xanthobacteraceae bacterium]|nr:phasin family protein [Xanthobacteraceae bacterium]
MTDYSTEISDTGSAAPIDAVAQPESTAEEAANAGARRYWANTDVITSLCLRLIDIAEANTAAAFELARALVKARGPGEIIESCSEHANKLFALFDTHAKELAAQAQEFSDRSIPPGAHSVH